MPIQDAKCRLLALMEDLSERHFHASWYIDLEYTLWRIAQAGVRYNSHFDQWIEAATLDELRQLSKQCGGWWVLDPRELPDGTYTMTRFVPMAEWLKMYQAHE